jgi:MerR family transcriptional regulator, light-induced transcriptional regulator
MTPADSARTRTYSIRELTRMTGLSADVLRVWERRYGFPQPSRDESGARIYSPSDVERLVLVQRALRRGHRIGAVIGHSDQELQSLVEHDTSDLQLQPGNSPVVERVMEALCSNDDQRMVWELRHAALNLGTQAFVREVAAPLTRAIGTAWEQGRVGIRHEHLLSDVLITQLRLMWAVQLGGQRGLKVLLATLPSEHHALGLEMVGAYLAGLGVTPRSMGPNVPPAEIADTVEALEVDGLGLSVSQGADLVAAQLNLNLLDARLGGRCPIAVGGAAAGKLVLPAGAALTSTWDQLDAWVRRLDGEGLDLALDDPTT